MILNIISRSKRWSADIITVLRFIEDRIENRGEDLQVDMGIELDEMIFQLCEFFEQKMIAKKAEWVNVFHNNRSH